MLAMVAAQIPTAVAHAGHEIIATSNVGTVISLDL